ncbi:hypothetical protein E4U23_006013 [Claviceps purpurea]|nr:hypothetical protein E4U23_006013 [Claviceps purpurea]
MQPIAWHEIECWILWSQLTLMIDRFLAQETEDWCDELLSRLTTTNLVQYPLEEAASTCDVSTRPIGTEKIPVFESLEDDDSEFLEDDDYGYLIKWCVVHSFFATRRAKLKAAF